MKYPKFISITDQAVGAWPNGRLVEKINSEPTDTHQDGARGRVVGSVGPLPDDIQDRYLSRYAYFVEWDDLPGFHVGIAERRLKEVAGG